MRYIHWKATAHRGSLQTKVFDPSSAPHWIIALNTQTLDHLYEGSVPDFLETAIVVAASLAHAGLESRRSVGLFTNSAVHGSDRPVRAARLAPRAAGRADFGSAGAVDASAAGAV